ECSEDDLVKALELAHDAIRVQIKAQKELRDKKGVTGKREYPKPEQDEELKQKVIVFSKDRMYQIAKSGTGKHERGEAFKTLKEELIASFGEDAEEEKQKLAKKYFEDLQWELVRNMILDDRTRLDGRQLDEVRSLLMEVDPLP